jgi:hypothetical protein
MKKLEENKKKIKKGQWKKMARLGVWALNNAQSRRPTSLSSRARNILFFFFC